MSLIQTPRLDLRSARLYVLLADLEGADELARELDVDVPDAWPPPLFDEAAIQWTIDRVTAGQPDEFLLYYWILRDQETLIGLGGYKGTPLDGRIEIGYSVLPEFQRRGLATEGVAGLVRFAFQHDEIHEVFAETLPHLEGSIGVLQKNRFELLGPGSEDGVIQFGLTREKWQRND